MTKIIPPDYITKSEEFYDKGYDPEVARGLMRFVKPYGRQMLISLVFMIIVTAAAVSGPYFVKLAIDDGIAKKDLSALGNIAIAYFVVAAIQLVTNFYRVRIMSRVGQHVLFDVHSPGLAQFGMLDLEVGHALHDTARGFQTTSWKTDSWANASPLGSS